MKTKVKRLSKRSLAVLLGVLMLVTSIGLGSLITANAYMSVFFYYKIGDGSWQNQSVSLSTNSGSVSLTLTSGTTMYSVIKTDNNEWYGNQMLVEGATRNLATLSSGYNYSTGSNNNTFTPSASGTYTFTLDMGSKKISVSGSSGGGGGSTGSGYYVEGRFRVYNSSMTAVYTFGSGANENWKTDSKNIEFEKTDDSNVFVLHTRSTVAELSEKIGNGNKYEPVFNITKGSTNYYSTEGGDETFSDDEAGESHAITLQTSTERRPKFDDADSTSTKWVDIYFNPTTMKLWFELVDTPVNYYIEGRFKVRDADGTTTTIGESGGWATDSKSIPFSPTTTENLYVLKTNSTLSELEADVGTTGDKVPYFYIGRGLGDRNPDKYFYTQNTSSNYLIYPTNAGVRIPTGAEFHNKNFLFRLGHETETGQFVTLYLDTSGATPVLYFEFEEPSYKYYIEGRFAVKNSARSSTTYLGASENTWTHSATNIPFNSTATSGLYMLETNMTVKELTTGGGANNEYFFVLGRGIRSAAPTKYFRTKTTADKQLKASDANKKFDGQWTGSWTDFSGYHYLFSDSSSSDSDSLVTFYYNENTDQFYFMLTPAEYDTTIYVVNKTSWSALDIYTWLEGGSGDTKTFGAWPGTNITSGASDYGNYNVTKSGDVYTVKFNKKSAGSVRFNNGDGGDHNQTADLTLTDGKTYIIKNTETSNRKDVTIADGKVVDFIAKDGMIRDDSHKSFGECATTTVTIEENVVEPNTATTAYSNTKYVTGWAVTGKNITVTTTINDAYKSKYYVAGFSFNGYTPQLLAESNDGVYTCTYTIPENFAYDTLEITPIFFLKSAYSANYVTFNIKGYESVKNEGWGSTLYIYPFYTGNGVATNYGAYPGQPVINYGGQYYTQIPTTTTGENDGKVIKGVTINNGFWDKIHRYVEGWSALDTADNDLDKSKHHQTYDFDDFYKIFKENGTNLNSIYFTFKYEEAQAHRTTVPSDHSSEAASSYRNDDIANTLTRAQMNAYDAANGFEDYVNANGKKIDLFGNVLSGSSLTADPIYVISQGYEYNNSGSFATEWVAFYWDSTNNEYQKVVESGGKNFTSIVPSVLHIKDYEHISTNYPAADGDLSVSDYEGIYRALEPYGDRPVKICYEKDIEGGHYNRNKNNESGYDQAYRCDGVWSSTLKTDFVSANTLIEYSDDNGASWHEDAFSGSTSTGSNTKCKAYFTYVDDAKNGYTASSDGATAISNVYVDDSKFFTFKAEAAGQYEFTGWKLRDSAGNETDINYDSEYAAETKMSNTVTLVAQFKKVSSGSLAVSHSIDASSEGLGTTYLGIRILNSDDNSVAAVIADVDTNTVAKTIGKTYIKSDSNQKIEITLKTVRSAENTFNKFTLSKDGAATIDTDATYLPSGTTPDATTTKTITFPITDLFTRTTQNLTSLAYYSVLNKTLYKYDVTYNYSDRDNASKSMRLRGEFTSAQMKAYVSGPDTSKTVAAGFYNDIKPNVSNFKNDITFDFDSPTSSSWAFDSDTSTYTLTAAIGSTATATLNRTVTFKTPYAMNNYVADETDGVYKYLSTPLETEPVTVTYGKLIKFAASGVIDLENGSFVTAPETLVEEKDDPTLNVIHYFKCWEIKTLSGETVACCYYPEFNYITYDNCVIEAVYSTESTHYYEYYDTAQALTATFLKNTRTQNNVGTYGDIIYSDFALSYKYKDVRFDKEATHTNYEAGVIIQQLPGAVDMDSDGMHTNNTSYYASKYSSTLTADETAIKNYLTSGGEAAPAKTRKQVFDYRSFDNKNRLEYYYGQYNSKNWDEDNQTWVFSKWDNDEGTWTTATNTNSKFVYRIFTYVIDKTTGGTPEVVLSSPSYFFLYNTANQ